MNVRFGYLALLLALSALVFRGVLRQVVELAWRHEHYSYILFVPLISAGLLYAGRARFFSAVEFSPRLGAALVCMGALACFALNHFAWAMGAVVLVWISGFLWFFGPQTVRAARFPLLTLALVIPLPSQAMKAIETFLQYSSAEVTHWLLLFSGMPFLRNGLQFSLPGVVVEVAPECSGIRSATGLMLTALVLGYLFLQSGWSRVSLLLLAIPITILKNATRIAILSWLGVNVSADYLHGLLHHRGGPLFVLLALALLLATLLMLQGAEGNRRKAPPGSGPVTRPVS